MGNYRSRGACSQYGTAEQERQCPRKSQAMPSRTRARWRNGSALPIEKVDNAGRGGRADGGGEHRACGGIRAAHVRKRRRRRRSSCRSGRPRRWTRPGPARRSRGWERQRGRGRRRRGRENLDELSDPAEPTKLIAMTEPVDLAEPVEGRRPRRGWQGALIALGFVVAAAAIVGARSRSSARSPTASRSRSSSTTRSRPVSLKTGQYIDPNRQTATIVSCGTPTTRRCSRCSSCPGRSGRVPRRWARPPAPGARPGSAVLKPQLA